MKSELLYYESDIVKKNVVDIMNNVADQESLIASMDDIAATESTLDSYISGKLSSSLIATKFPSAKKSPVTEKIVSSYVIVEPSLSINTPQLKVPVQKLVSESQNSNYDIIAQVQSICEASNIASSLFSNNSLDVSILKTSSPINNISASIFVFYLLLLYLGSFNVKESPLENLDLNQMKRGTKGFAEFSQINKEVHFTEPIKNPTHYTKGKPEFTEKPPIIKESIPLKINSSDSNLTESDELSKNSKKRNIDECDISDSIQLKKNCEIHSNDTKDIAVTAKKPRKVLKLISDENVFM